MKEKLLIYLYDGMADFEFSFLVALLSNLDPELEIISISEDIVPVTSAYGIKFIPQMKISDIQSLDDVAALVIPGGESEDISDDFSTLIRSLDKDKKLLAAICFGPLFLARAGVLGRSTYTTTALPEVLEEKGLADPFNRDYYRQEPVVLDNHFITATGAAFIDFAIETADYLGLIADETVKVQLTKVYKNIS